MWTRIGRPRKTLASAASAMAQALCSSTYRFGDVIMTTDDGYYEPVVLVESKRR
jgi:hypothetical protein